jgi:hypothetical protein
MALVMELEVSLICISPMLAPVNDRDLPFTQELYGDLLSLDNIEISDAATSPLSIMADRFPALDDLDSLGTF